ncbi:hypothetical protein E4T38_02914 [Aureobasidium subglaciale]|nr:hypothetical protein E4T38_02914 [Aureobasidium subglaciale]KAI5227239.1 hypothetical protein E4T40_02649 [Aureobasidium subglaciale]KAI5230551.1 hypothetical protein E4T41_02913 [Aureobasidium subglaciale]KAI5264851.1 hypothetical protein E4T46_02691 [Aureobasidium subglaciale]
MKFKSNPKGTIGSKFVPTFQLQMFINQDECFQTITSIEPFKDQSLEQLRLIDYESLHQSDSSLSSEPGLPVAPGSAAPNANTLAASGGSDNTKMETQSAQPASVLKSQHSVKDSFASGHNNMSSEQVCAWLNAIPPREPKEDVADTTESKSFFGLPTKSKLDGIFQSDTTPTFSFAPVKKKAEVSSLKHSKQNVDIPAPDSIFGSLPKTKAVTTFSCDTSGPNSDKNQSAEKLLKDVSVVPAPRSIYDPSTRNKPASSSKVMANELSTDNPASKPAMAEQIKPSGYHDPFRSISTMAADLPQALSADNPPVKVLPSLLFSTAPPTNLFGSQSTTNTALPSFDRGSSPPQVKITAPAFKFDIPPSPFTSASNQQQSKLGSVFGERGKYMLLHHTGENHASGADEQLRTTPLLSLTVKEASEARYKNAKMFPQYAFLGCRISDPLPANEEKEVHESGSGKGYTLSAIIENCLFASSKVGVLPKPLAGVVFHNNTASSHNICEAAYLVSLGVRVNILVSRSNYHALSSIYKTTISSSAAHLLDIQPLVLQSHHLTAERMHRLMAFQESETTVPLYMEVIMRILREMAMSGLPFNYATFKANLDNEGLQPGQKVMMDMRLNLLESFLDPSCIKATKASKTAKKSDMFTTSPGTLTIVDLSDPFLDSSTTCTLFDILLSLFISSRPESGPLLCLDEAHKFMQAAPAAETFTENLLTVIREQRHNACRVVIATQEPTISPKLLDLCSIPLVHRFTSPDWLATLRGHLAGASDLVTVEQGQGKKQGAAKLFEQIINLDVGESLLFAPSAILDEDEDGRAKKLGTQCVRFKTRVRLGTDGGKSILAVRA